MSTHDDEALIRAAAREVDQSLLEWFASLSISERLRTASRNAATLERMKRGATSNR